MLIEAATPQDIPQLSGLLSELFAQEEEFTPDARAQGEGLARIIGDPKAGAVLVARQDENIVGMVNLQFTVSTALGGPVALLEDLVVAPGCRRTGLGTRLLTAAIALARARGCKRATLLTDHSNESAQRLYGRHGFIASGMIPMRLLLE